MLQLHDGGTRLRPQGSSFDEEKFVPAVLWDCFATYLPTDTFEVTQVFRNVFGDWVKCNEINTNEREFEVVNGLDTYSKYLGEEIDMIATAIQHIPALEDNGHMPICEARTSGCPTTVTDSLRDKLVPHRGCTAALKCYFLWRQVHLQGTGVDHLLPLIKMLDYRLAPVYETKHHLSLLRPASMKQGALSAKVFQNTNQTSHTDNSEHTTSAETHSLTTTCLSRITAESGEPVKKPPTPLVLDTERHQALQASAVATSGKRMSDSSMTPNSKRPQNPRGPRHVKCLRRFCQRGLSRLVPSHQQLNRRTPPPPAKLSFTIPSPKPPRRK